MCSKGTEMISFFPTRDHRSPSQTTRNCGNPLSRNFFLVRESLSDVITLCMYLFLHRVVAGVPVSV